MAFYFTADTHFGREAFFSENWGERPKIWNNVTEMNEALIKNWNDTVGRNDIVFIIGDYSDIDNSYENIKIWNRLNGKKTLILGNHDTDKRLNNSHFPMGKVTFPSCTSVTISNWELFLCHYPTIEWKNKFKWIGNDNKVPHAIHLYGHVHSKHIPELEGMRAYNVGVDANDFKPVSLEHILKSLNLTN